jgi:ornithine cyclodeaminase/alanine dehydrogenase-like protein (mu-crystallin family)
MLKVVEEAQMESLLDRREAIEIVERAYRAAAAGGAAVSHPAALHLRGRTGAGATFKVKGAVLDALNVAGFRLIADVPPAAGEGSAYLYIADAVSGAPLGLVSELRLHRLRTASTGLVACRALMPPGTRRLALVGTGRIAEEFVRSVHLIFPEFGIILASRSAERAKAAAGRWQPLTPNRLSSAASVPDAVAQADIVVTLSDADERLFKATDLKPTALVCAMGGRHEFESDVLRAADRFVVDEIDFVCTAGNAAHWIASGQVSREEVAKRVDATIGEVLTASRRVRSTGIVLAIIQGMAICDLALAKAVLDRLSNDRVNP